VAAEQRRGSVRLKLLEHVAAVLGIDGKNEAVGPKMGMHTPPLDAREGEGEVAEIRLCCCSACDGGG
jgi:hypothetical protein